MSDTISRAKAIEAVAEALRGLPVVCKDIAKEAIEQLPPAQPEIINCDRCIAANRSECIWHNAGATYCSLGEVTK